MVREEETVRRLRSRECCRGDDREEDNWDVLSVVVDKLIPSLAKLQRALRLAESERDKRMFICIHILEMVNLSEYYI